VRPRLVLTRAAAALVFLLILLAIDMPPAHASYGNVHFGRSLVAAPSLDSLTVAGTLEGTGKQPYIDMVLTATSDCGGTASVDSGPLAVTGGVMVFDVTLIAPCAAALWSAVTITETVTGASSTFDGTFQWVAA
jgi:hypothetical protein